MRHLSSFAWVLATVVVSSQAVAATDPLDFIEAYRDADAAKLKELKKTLREERAALTQSYNSEEIKKKREEIIQEKLKAVLAEDLRNKFAGKVNSTDELETLFSREFGKADKKVELETFKNDLEKRALSGATTDVKPVQATLEIEGSPVHLVAKISANSANKPVMEFSLEPTTDPLTNVRREAKALPPSVVQDFYKTEASRKLFDGKAVELTNFKGGNVEEWSKGAAEQAAVRVFKEDTRKDIDALVKDKSMTNNESTVFRMNEELIDMEDKVGRKNELNTNSFNEKVRTWLETHTPSASLTECEIIIQAVPIEEIPEKAKQKCADSDPKMKALVAKPGDKDANGKPIAKGAKDNAEGADVDPKNAANPQQAGAAVNPSQDWFQAARGCAAYQRQLAAMSSTSAMRQATSPLEAIYRSMLGSGFVDCPLYNQMMDTGMIGSPYLYDAQGKAADVLTRNYTQNTFDNYKKLQSASECVRKILSVTTAMLNNLSANGTVDPFMMMDPNIQKMMMHQSAARELMGAIENSMSARVAENKWKMQVGTGGASTGVPVVGNTGAGAGGWAPVGTSGGAGSRPADRRLAPSNARGGARGTRPSLLK